MRLKEVGLLCGLLAGLGLSARAQDGPPPGPPPGMMGGDSTIDVRKFAAERELARLTKKYKLSEQQRAKIQPMLAEQEKRVHALGEDNSLSDAEWTAAVRKVHLETVAKVKQAMTDDQASRYSKDEEKRAKSNAAEDQMQGGPDGPPSGPPPDGGGPPPM